MTGKGAAGGHSVACITMPQEKLPVKSRVAIFTNSAVQTRLFSFQGWIEVLATQGANGIPEWSLVSVPDWFSPEMTIFKLLRTTTPANKRQRWC
jgi:hypothetical protein